MPLILHLSLPDKGNVMRRSLLFAVLVCGLLAGGGCVSNESFLTEDLKENGLVIILPGIEGPISGMSEDVRDGLVRAGICRAMPIYAWGRPLPLVGPLVNQMDVLGNRLEGKKIARMIERYQDQYPGRPVHLIGHSGGGGVAVFAAEYLSEGREISGIVMLSPSISSAYNMTKALNKCRDGIVNFYSNSDVGFLVIGTSLAGNVDGIHGPAAGAVGCDTPGENASPGKKFAYHKLYQVEFNAAMTGSADAHTASTGVGFVLRHVAPWIVSSSWPVADAASQPEMRLAAGLGALASRTGE